MTHANATICHNCGASAGGRFCSSCGTPVAGAQCRTCKAPLAAGAKFCQQCGSPVGATARRATPSASGAAPPSLLPWVIGGVAVVVMIILVAARSSTTTTPAQASAAMPFGGGQGPDLSTMTPRERADRLFNRVMSYHERGVTDSMQFFADMGIRAYEMLPSIDADGRYDMGRIAEVSGRGEIARAQSDTILRESPTHLLGLVLGARAARLTGDNGAARRYDRQLLAAEAAERQKNLIEYQRHAADIDEALRTARGQAP